MVSNSHLISPVKRALMTSNSGLLQLRFYFFCPVSYDNNILSTVIDPLQSLIPRIVAMPVEVLFLMRHIHSLQ